MHSTGTFAPRTTHTSSPARPTMRHSLEENAEVHLTVEMRSPLNPMGSAGAIAKPAVVASVNVVLQVVGIPDSPVAPALQAATSAAAPTAPLLMTTPHESQPVVEVGPSSGWGCCGGPIIDDDDCFGPPIYGVYGGGGYPGYGYGYYGYPCEL